MSCENIITVDVDVDACSRKGPIFDLFPLGQMGKKTQERAEIASVSKGKIRVSIVAGTLNTPKHTAKKTVQNTTDRTGHFFMYCTSKQNFVVVVSLGESGIRLFDTHGHQVRLSALCPKLLANDIQATICCKL